jgi:hypothetical protein
MTTELTRSQLRSRIDPELIKELSVQPIRPMQIGNYLYRPEAAWRMLILQTVLPFCRHQVRELREHAHLLTDEEQVIAERYAEIIADFEKDWREKPLSFPRVPNGFEEILMD